MHRHSLGRFALTIPVAAFACAAVLTTSAPASAAPQAGQVFFEAASSSLVFSAGNGTVNELVVRATTPGFEIEDTRGDIVLDTSRSGGCTQANQHKVTCPNIPVKLSVDLRDGNDGYFGGMAPIPVSVLGSDGHDTIYSGAGPHTINGGSGDDLIYGSVLDDNIDGGAGFDKVFGGDGRDSLSGGTQDDDLNGGAGNDTLLGNDGKDSLSGNEDDDLLEGGSGIDSLHGNAGKDQLWGNHNGADKLFGDDGDDRLIGASQGDYSGGNGTDTIVYYMSEGVLVSLDGATNDGVRDCPTGACPFGNVRPDIEHVRGGSGDDIISGSGANNNIDGGSGSDKLLGMGGDDYLDAQTGTNQKLDGGPGKDTCVGFDLVAQDNCEI
jgi:Ca2+-binding RTX toxin-like protein